MRIGTFFSFVNILPYFESSLHTCPRLKRSVFVVPASVAAGPLLALPARGTRRKPTGGSSYPLRESGFFSS